MQILSNPISALNIRESPKFSRLTGNLKDVRFLLTGSGNTAVLCMRNASDDNYSNSSFIVDEAMGQVPRSSEQNVFLVYLLCNRT